MRYTLKNAFYALSVDTLGAEAVSIKNVAGKELLWQNTLGEGWNHHAPLLFPFCGRLKDNRFFYKGKAYTMQIHGIAMHSEFELTELSDTKITLLLKSDEQTRSLFPFDFKLTVSYELLGDEISLRARVENTGDELMPFSFGWHPGFVLFTDEGQDIEDYAVKFKNKKELTRVISSGYDNPHSYEPYPTPNSEYKLCEAEIYENDTMVFMNSGNEIRLCADGYPYALDMSYSDNLPVLCIWKMPRHEAKYICLEPWSHTAVKGEGANVLETRKVTRLAAGEKEDFSYTLKFKFDR